LAVLPARVKSVRIIIKHRTRKIFAGKAFLNRLYSLNKYPGVAFCQAIEGVEEEDAIYSSNKTFPLLGAPFRGFHAPT